MLYIVYGGSEDYDAYSSYNIKGAYTSFDKALDNLKMVYNSVKDDLTYDCELDEVLYQDRYEEDYELFDKNEFAWFEIKGIDGSYRIYYEVKKVEIDK